MKSGCFSGPGLLHQGAGRPNEDAAFHEERDGFHVVVLCDGGSGCARAYTAANLVAFVASSYLRRNFNDCLWKDSSVLRRELNHLITTALSGVAEQLGEPPEDFGTAFLAAAMDEDGRYCLFHLGDGVAYVDREGAKEMEEISFPQCILDGGTSLTMNCTIDDLRFCRSTEPAQRRMYLLTDGGMDLLAKLSFNLKKLPEFPEMQQDPPEDDYSVGWLFSE